MLDVTKARACLLTNLLVLPGLGSVVASRATGWLQMTLSVLGVCASGTGAIWSFRWIVKNREAMAEGAAQLADLMLPLGVAVVGLALFAAAWLWGLFTGIGLLSEAKRDAPPPAS